MHIDWGMVMIWMIVIVPVLAVFGIYFWLDRKEKQRGTRFLGIQLDIAILLIGVLMLLALIKWIYSAIFG
ncbi:MAG: hypothetical protein AABZ15_03300 [Nitrospirota bacterium]